MATQLIKHLKTCADNDSIYKPLEAQWAFDERLIAKALQTVGNYFPHYSRHDESHSRQILVHIERLLGDNISQLSATDTWLLLEAAYLHDIGMVISDEHLTKDFDEIKQHVEKNRHTATGDSLKLMNALLASKEKTASAVFANVDIHPFQATKLLREIIADFYRVKHPERADLIINTPLDIGLESPRNELLPRRFFSLLGKICGHHGKPFAEVMKLPKQQVGIGTDECHPRFVACLLRLGDLLDLDDNRFCPVMLKMAGELPSLSKAHHEKHLAIRHFRADRERIEIEADCPSYESYIETNKWFGWLREEVKNQMSQWFDIVPSREFGLLPSVGDLKAHLQNWQVFNDNERPHFTLDRDRIFELLQGAGLYESKEQAMRELLQNAVDATLIRIWLEHGEDCIPTPNNIIHRNDAPRADNVRDILKNYPIEVSIDKENEGEQHNYWRITISDQGTGISKDDLTYMMQMGSSKKNVKKRAIIDTMPIWMRPSGIFGIGLHSIFLLSDEVIIETRSIDTGENLVIRFTNPTSAEEHGNVYFQIISEPRKIKLGDTEKEREFKPWSFARYGSQLSFIYKTIKGDFSIDGSDELEEIINSHDGLLEPVDIFEVFKLKKSVDKFFEYSMLRGKIDFFGDSYDSNEYLNNSSYFYYEENKLEIMWIDANVIGLCFESENHRPYKRSLYYRGQEIENIFELESLSLAINLLDENADEILAINRNSLKDKDNVYDLIKQRVTNTIQKFFMSPIGEKYYEELEEKLKLSIATEYKLKKWKLPKYFANYTKINIVTNEGLKSLDELNEYDNVLIDSEHNIYFTGILPDENQAEIIKDELDKLSSKNIIILSPTETGQQLFGIFFSEQKMFNAQLLIKKDKDVIKFSKEELDIIDNSFICNYCEGVINNINHSILKRKNVPCLNNFSQLILNNPEILPKIRGNDYDYIGYIFNARIMLPLMLFPLAKIGKNITVGDLDILAKRVYKNRADESVTEQQIKDKYEEFIGFIDSLMKDNLEWVKLRGNEFKPT